MIRVPQGHGAGLHTSFVGFFEVETDGSRRPLECTLRRHCYVAFGQHKNNGVSVPLKRQLAVAWLPAFVEEAVDWEPCVRKQHAHGGLEIPAKAATRHNGDTGCNVSPCVGAAG